jgi:1D-myo-inositol 3-kinase
MPEQNKVPDFLAIGHVTKDLLVGGGFVLGGTATYASITARNLGRQAGVITSAGVDLTLDGHLRGIQIVKRPASETTTFQNIYINGSRQQYVKGMASALTASDVPAAWHDVPIVLLGPLVREVGMDIARLFSASKSLLGITAQGWMRQWNGDGLVTARFWEEADEILPMVDVLIFSFEDVARDIAVVEKYAAKAKTTVVTHGDRGAVVYSNRGMCWSPAFESGQVDPTGAGDVFAAAYLIALSETRDPLVAARFANCTASFSIEGQATSAIPTRAQVEDRLAHGRLIDIDCDRDPLLCTIRRCH